VEEEVDRPALSTIRKGEGKKWETNPKSQGDRTHLSARGKTSDESGQNYWAKAEEKTNSCGAHAHESTGYLGRKTTAAKNQGGLSRVWLGLRVKTQGEGQAQQRRPLETPHLQEKGRRGPGMNHRNGNDHNLKVRTVAVRKWANVPGPRKRKRPG